MKINNLSCYLFLIAYINTVGAGVTDFLQQNLDRLADKYIKVSGNVGFNFHQIAGDIGEKKLEDKVLINIDDNKITAFYDGKKCPLFLGSIPTENWHVSKLQQCATLKHAPIEIYSLNTKKERDSLGLSLLIVRNSQLIHFKYPTQDHYPSSLVDIIRAVRDLDTRDQRSPQLVLVHCKMGIGRSPLIVAAYLAHIAFKEKCPVNVQQILEYVRLKRSLIYLNAQQKNALYAFDKILKEAGNFDNLYTKYKSEIEKRDKEVLHL